MQTGLLAEFQTPDQLLAAARRLRDRGVARLDSFSPFPLHGLTDALGPPRSRLSWYVFAGGMLGAAAAYLLQYWVAAVDYPLNVGGRPAHAIPAFVIITFEMGVLGAVLAAFITLLAKAGLPRPWHPVFEVPGFERASVDRFWLGVDATDPAFDREALTDELRGLGALRVEWVSADGEEAAA